ncbi:hypothetical protein RF11_16255 [Thelohanellus kitauei]|uniref:Uncharacterized protein n=1 Tax=Thelohanellus kitauei TaxID=669202 RepID=A0A0C2JJL1_THEKT|nr:hypothetical protein RF11_13658 [Thelohanellus kitauei]KII69588.1 hypothetical protein RF11_16255 [Thelohanellus kitauei]
MNRLFLVILRKHRSPSPKRDCGIKKLRQFLNFPKTKTESTSECLKSLVEETADKNMGIFAFDDVLTTNQTSLVESPNVDLPLSYEKVFKVPQLKITNALEESRIVFVSLTFKNKIPPESSTFFRDFDYLFTKNNNSIVFEINFNHMALLQEFLNKHLKHYQFVTIKTTGKDKKPNEITLSYEKLNTQFTFPQ